MKKYKITLFGEVLVLFIIIIISIYTYNTISHKNSKMDIHINAYGLTKAKEKKTTINEINTVINILKSKKYMHLSSDLRKFPYPYNAMLSICSDIDGTTLNKFEEYHKFLNTKGDSIYGKGLGLDIGDSFWVYMGEKNDEPVNDIGNSTMTAFYGTDCNKI